MTPLSLRASNEAFRGPDNRLGCWAKKCVEMRAFGIFGFVEGEQDTVLWFDLELTDFYKKWKGRLIVDWPPPELIMVALGGQESHPCIRHS